MLYPVFCSELKNGTLFSRREEDYEVEQQLQCIDKIHGNHQNLTMFPRLSLLTTTNDHVNVQGLRYCDDLLDAGFFLINKNSTSGWKTAFLQTTMWIIEGIQLDRLQNMISAVYSVDNYTKIRAELSTPYLMNLQQWWSRFLADGSACAFFRNVHKQRLDSKSERILNSNIRWQILFSIQRNEQ